MTEIKEQNEKIDKLFKMNEEKDHKINKLTENIIELYKTKKDRKKDEINIIYTNNGNDGDEFNILGAYFIQNNYNKIEIYKNGRKYDLKERCYLGKGENKIKIKIKNKINDFSSMFYNCPKLKNIDELKYLNIEDCINFSYMFYNCTKLTDIKPLENWNVSKCNNFSSMFYGCGSLSDIKP